MVERITVSLGTFDILPNKSGLWQQHESTARRIFSTYNFREIRTPIFEDVKLFKRSLGQTSDVVNKQLLELKSSKEDGFALRPEGTASIVRSYIENRLDKQEGLSKLYYIGPMFRGERPQKGRFRQFHQIGAEILGPKAQHPFLDVEIIALAVELLKSFGVEGSELVINTLGSMTDKESFSRQLRELLKSKLSSLCEECQSRFERNVFRVLDCKNESCRKIINSLKLDHSYLSPNSQRHYEQVKLGLKRIGIPYKENTKLVRGLDYYTHTIFEITNSNLGSQDALCAGGRYNHLVSALGGEDVPAIGFALGIERAILAMKDPQKSVEPSLQGYIVALDEPAMQQGLELLNVLRSQGIRVDMNFREGSMKSLMREADKSQAARVIIIGEKELKSRKATVKDMKSGEQREIAFTELVEALKG